MIESFRADLPVRVSFGDGAIGELPGLVSGRRAMVVVEEPVAAIPAVAEAIDGIPAIVKPAGEPTFALIAETAGAVADGAPDLLIGIGGGSAIDVAKAARLVAGQGIPFERFCHGEAAVAPPAFDLVSVPTTSGTGSEVSGGAVVVDEAEGRKLGVAHPLMRAQHALVDPLLTLGLPRDATAFTGLDALAQAIGAVIVSNGSVLSAAIGLEACRHVVAGLEPAVRDGGDRDARRSLALGSLMAGLGMNLSDCGADHALGHSIGSTLGLPHGLTVGLVLAETLDVNRPHCAAALERVADAMGEPTGGPADGSRAIAAVYRILAATGFPTAREAGVADADLDRLVELSLADYCLTVNPKAWDEADVRSAYGAALALRER